MSRNVGAVRAVKKYAPESEWAELFAMLDLVRGDRVAPDAPPAKGMDQLRTTGGKKLLEGRTERLSDRPKESTAPEALRVLAPLKTVKPGPPKKRVAPKEKRPRKVAQCGTDAGYSRHIKGTLTSPKSEPCEPCRAAHRAACKRKPTIRRAKGRPPCGTTRGYRAHRYRDEDACPLCKEAERVEAQRKRDEKKQPKGMAA